MTTPWPDEFIIVQKQRVDEELDQRWIVSPRGIAALNRAGEIGVGPPASPPE
jgi:hypothetical protein